MMKQLLKHTALAIVAIVALGSCDDNTGNLGIYATQDGVSTSTSIFEFTTRSVAMGAVVADNDNAYLGKVIDPETDATITAECAAQFFCFENYNFPAKSLMLGKIDIDPATGDTLSIERGVPTCDSCEVRIYIDDYYGDANNPMKLEVYELDDKNVMEESETYYTDIDLTQFVKSGTPIASKVFTVTDYILSESELTSDSHTDNIRIMLPTSVGQSIMDKYYENSSNFQDSYHFIRNVFPGLYFKISSGEGTMLKMLVSSMNVYYNYGDKEEPDSVYGGLSRFTATPEVIQSTRIQNGNMDHLVSETQYTYLKTPAGICTEMTLPIDEVFDEHPTDSVSMAEVTLTRYNKQSQDDYQLGTPKELLMVRKQNMESFFANNDVADGRTSYVASFNSTYNTYTFTNICRLLAYCKHEKMEAAAAEGISEEAWAAKNPDWNKVMLVPVVTSSNSSGTLTNVNHDMSMNSVKLVGGDTPLKMQIIYSKFYQE